MSKQMQGYRGSLDLYFQIEDDAGNFGEIFDAGNVTDFSISPQAEELEIIDTGNANYGQAADTMIDAQPTTFSFNVNRFNLDNWAVAFGGTYAARTAAEKPVAAANYTAPPLGGMIKLVGLDVKSIVIQDETDTDTYVEDIDYKVVDAALGIIQILAGGGIAEGDVLHIAYSTSAESGFLLSGGTKTSRFLRMWGRGINRFNNKRCLINIGRGSVKSGGAFSFVGTDAAAMQFDGVANVPTDGSAVFTIVTDE